MPPPYGYFDMMVQMYGALFLMAGPYALAQDTHVRADVIYRFMSARGQALLDLIFIHHLLFPGHGSPCSGSAGKSPGDSWRYKEVSWNSPARIQIYFFKTLIPLAGAIVYHSGRVLNVCDAIWR